MKKAINWIDSVGIGLFMMSSIMYFSIILENLLLHFLIIIEVDPKIILLSTKAASLILVIVITVLVINKMNTLDQVVSRKNLKRATSIFFVMIIIQVLYSFYGNQFMYDIYPEEFDAFYDVSREDFLLMELLKFIPLLKYLAFGTILLLKKDNATDEKRKRESQISEIGNS